MIRVYDGGQEVKLSDQNLIGAGGEGAVYAVGPLAYKIYHDKSRALPAAKIVELARIKHPKVSAPQEPVTDSRGVVVGYRMGFSANCKTLLEVSTIAYRDRLGITLSQMESIVDDLAEVVRKVHEADVVIVDLNDLNVLVRSSHREVVLIDLDSVQTPSFPVTAIMDIVRDPIAPPGRYKPDSDWFAFAVLAFRAFTGSGPYRGFHPKGKLEIDRKDKGLSAFDQGARLPGCALPIDSIPTRYRDWMRLVLSHKHRGAPGLVAAVQVAAPQAVLAAVQAGQVLFALEAVRILGSQVHRAWMVGSDLLTLAGDGLYRSSKKVLSQVPSSARLAVHPRTGIPVLAWVQDGRLALRSVTCDFTEVTDVQADDISEAGPNLLVRTGGGIYRLSWTERVDRRFVVGLDRVSNCLPLATLLGDGAAVVRGLGRALLQVLPDGLRCVEVPLPDLDDARIVSVRGCGNVAVVGVVRNKTGRRDLLVVRVDPSTGKHDSLLLSDAGSEADFAVSASGTCAVRTEDGVRFVSSQVGNTQQAGWDLPSGVRGPLWNLGGKVASARGDQVVYLRSLP